MSLIKDVCSYNLKKLIITVIWLLFGIVFFGLLTYNLGEKRWIQDTCKTAGYEFICPDFKRHECILYRTSSVWNCESSVITTPAKDFPITEDIRVFSFTFLLYVVTNPLGKEEDCWVMSDCSVATYTEPDNYSTLKASFAIQIGLTVIFGLYVLSSVGLLLGMFHTKYKEENEDN